MKPNKKQQAILDLLVKIETEGFHYALTCYGVDDNLAKIKDNKLNKLSKAFINASFDLEEYIDELKESVEMFLDDDSDF